MGDTDTISEFITETEASNSPCEDSGSDETISTKTRIFGGQSDLIQTYWSCRLQDWERVYRSIHPSRVLRVDHLLTELNLGGLHMGTIPDPEFFRCLPSLRFLWIHDNDLFQLNGVLKAVPRLLGLWVSNNRLSNMRDQLRSLHSLEVLDLSINELHDFEVSSQNPD
ncbi:unnamed protein product [Echinostoma caproni]|uniref:Leucine-rich repeat-containing protein 51 n=1 Tax=Echinostoma caproni TaxID=27848 RepID=A0A183AQL8_9TREM|nr:unnamed protein product [Echinostoma caproni]